MLHFIEQFSKKGKRLSRHDDLPSWQFGSHLYFSVTDATFALGGYPGAHDWVDDSARCCIAHCAARRLVRVGTPRQVERVPIKNPLATDDIRRQRGMDVQFAIADERVVRRRRRHLEFAIPAILVKMKKWGKGDNSPIAS